MKYSKSDNYVATVIGSGPNGILASKLLLDAGIPVTLIEAGNKSNEHHLNLTSYVWESKSKMPDGVHMVGGGTTKWHGRISKLPESIFKRENLNGVSTWPIEHREFEKNYRKLLEFLQIENVEYENSILKKFHKCGFCENIFDISPFQIIQNSKFVKIFTEILGNKNLRFLPNTYCESIKRESSDFLSIKVLDGQSNLRELQSNYVFISCGAVQSAALVNRSFPDKRRLYPIGSFLMEHFDGFIGNLILKQTNFDCLKKFVSNNFERTLFLNFGSGLQNKKNDLVTYHFEFVNYRRTYLFDIKLNQFNIKKLFLLKLLFQVERVLTYLPNRLWRSYHRFRGREIYSIWLKGEELPYRESIIELSANSKKEVKYIHRISKLTKAELTKDIIKFSNSIFQGNLGKVRLHLKVYFSRFFQTGGNFHSMGTLRMHSDLNLAVITSNQNLIFEDKIFIIDASVFPFGGYQNPTINALTLTYRAVTNFIKRYANSYEN